MSARRGAGWPLDRVVGSLTLAALAYATMQMMVVPALPAIQRDLGASPGDVAWLISAFLLSTAVATPVLGRLGDLYGKERVLIAVLALFACGSVVGGLARSLAALVAARVLQGLGGAVFPLAFGLARDVLPRERVPVAIGVIAGSFGIGGSVGLVLSGPLVDHVSWHAIFWVGLAIPLAAIACVRAFVPESPARTRVRLDWPGALLLAGGLLALLLGVAHGRGWGWGSARVLGLFAGGAALLLGWWRWELRRPEPLVDVRLLARRAMWPANAAAVLVGFCMYATGFLVPQLVQADPRRDGFGFAAGVTGASLFLLPALVAGLFAGAWGGRLDRRAGARVPLLGGVATMLAGYLVLALAHDVRWTVYVGALLAHGIGLNLAYTAMANQVVAVAPLEQTGVAAGMNTMLRTVGGSVGSQVVGAIVAGAAVAGGMPREEGFTLSFLLCAALMALALAIAAVALQRRPRGETMATVYSLAQSQRADHDGGHPG